MGREQVGDLLANDQGFQRVEEIGCADKRQPGPGIEGVGVGIRIERRSPDHATPPLPGFTGEFRGGLEGGREDENGHAVSMIAQPMPDCPKPSPLWNMILRPSATMTLG